MGRFISTDPIGFAGGDANLYRYGGNDSVNRRDPSGLYYDDVGYQLDFGGFDDFEFGATDFAFDSLDFGSFNSSNSFDTGSLGFNTWDDFSWSFDPGWSTDDMGIGTFGAGSFFLPSLDDHRYGFNQQSALTQWLTLDAVYDGGLRGTGEHGGKEFANWGQTAQLDMFNLVYNGVDNKQAFVESLYVNQAALKASIDRQNAYRWHAEYEARIRTQNRVMGGIQAAGAVFEVGLSLAAVPFTVDGSSVTAFHGLDQFQAGFRQAWSGDQTNSFGSTVAHATLGDGFAGQAAGFIYDGWGPTVAALRFPGMARGLVTSGAPRLPIVGSTRFASSAAEHTARQAAQRFNNFDCFNCADAIETALLSKGQSGYRVSLNTRSSFGQKAMISNRTFNFDVISENGLHEAVYVDRFIFDNHNPNGILPLNFFNDLHIGPPIRPYFDIPFQIDVNRIGR